MSTRYTLRLETDGKEVFKRWSGDREEVLRLAVPALVDLGVAERLAEMFLAGAKAASPPPGHQAGSAVHSPDLRSMLTFEVRTTGGS